MTKLAVLDRLSSKAVIFWILITAILTANLTYSYLSYKKLTEFEYATLDAKLISSKEKRGKNGAAYFSLFFRADGLDFRAYSKTDMKSKESERFAVVVKTKELSFVDTFKTPRLRILALTPLGEKDKLQAGVKEFISSQHEDIKTKEIYLNLFLNAEVGEDVENFINGYGLGAFFAISGLNVALLTAFIFLLLTPPFRLIQDRFFPYVNRQLWIFLFCLAVLVFYAYLTDFTASFARAVVAAFILFYFALRGDEILSYKTLFLTTLLCLALFPSFLFSVGFWLSLYGVFLIYLFLANTEFKRKAVVYVALSSWLFFAMLPVIHYIFGIFTKAHLMNSFFSAIFDVFYPVSLAAHLFGLGWIFDGWLIEAVNSSKWLAKSEFLTPLWFFVSYLVLSLVAAFNKRLFFVFNVLIVAYFVAAMIFLRYQGISV